MATYHYIKKCITSIEKIIGRKIGKAKTPCIQDWHPEEYDSPFLNSEERKKYQQLVGMGIWLQLIGRINITLPITVLSRYSHIAREEHMKDLIKIFEYLKIADEEISLEISELLCTSTFVRCMISVNKYSNLYAMS